MARMPTGDLHVEYEHTFEDFHEMSYAASRLIQPAAKGASPGQRRARIFSWSTLVFWFATFVVLGREMIPPEAGVIYHWLMPVFTAGVLSLAWMGIRQKRLTPKGRFWKEHRREIFKAVLAIAIFGAILAGLIWLSRRHGEDPTAEVDLLPMWMFLSPHLGWIVGYAWLTWHGHSTIDANIKAAWERLRDGVRPTTLDASDDGIAFTDGLGRLETRWAAFARYLETDHLFLLCTGHDPSQYIPKRAFHDEKQLSRFRELLKRNISQRPSGFPVLPAQAPATPNGEPG